MRTIVQSVALTAMLLASTTSLACTVSLARSLEYDPKDPIELSTAIVAGRATSVRTEQREFVIARLEIDTVFKGQVPRVLVFRASSRNHPCGEIMPPGSEPFYAFIRFERGNIQAPEWIGFVPQAGMPSDFSRKLGTPMAASADSAPLLQRLAPSVVPTSAIRRTEGEVSTETWRVIFEEKSWFWDGKPRFYLRYPHATFLFEPDYVLEQVARWQSKDLLEAIRRSLPLSESTDLFKFQLNMRISDDRISEQTDRLAITATIERRAQIMWQSQCCLRTVDVNRSSLGTQSVTYNDAELVSSTWQPEDRATSD